MFITIFEWIAFIFEEVEESGHSEPCQIRSVTIPGKEQLIGNQATVWYRRNRL